MRPDITRYFVFAWYCGTDPVIYGCAPICNPKLTEFINHPRWTDYFEYVRRRDGAEPPEPVLVFGSFYPDEHSALAALDQLPSPALDFRTLRKYVRGRSRTIVRSDGVVFPSINQAAIETGVHVTSIYQHLKNPARNKTVHGYTFKYEG